MNIDGRTKLLTLIGSPIGHSKSPHMYNYCFEKLGINMAYLAFDITVDKLPQSIEAIKTLNVACGNVTMPCKIEVLKYLDELSPGAEIIGAVNTFVNNDGKLKGYNTDGEGFVRNLKEHGVDVKGKKMTVLGIGGVATAIDIQSALDGASEISIFNIKDAFFDNVITTVDKINTEIDGCKASGYDLQDTETLLKEISESDILVNATRIGMKPHDEKSLVPAHILRPDLIVADTVYDPVETRLLREAKEAGCTTIDGLGMMLWQGAIAFKYFTGQDMPTQGVLDNVINN